MTPAGVMSYRKINIAAPFRFGFETVFDKAGDADVWTIKYNRDRDMTYSDLKADYMGYTGFKAFKTHGIFTDVIRQKFLFMKKLLSVRTICCRIWYRFYIPK